MINEFDETEELDPIKVSSWDLALSCTRPY